ncbi:Clp protease N-terminal domain-containing protein [Streptomyces sp. BH105]|uniref:Clp protease N-terminal domain-containing protein n=1 Tax=Streptomyces sp. BH105 TaxID=3410408 RepID=UPI003CEB21B5
MDQRTSTHDTGLATEFEKDVVKLLLEALRAVAKQEREDLGTESVLHALVSGDSAAGSAIAPGMRASGSLAGSIGCRGTSVWVSADAGDGVPETPDDEREIDAVWREVRHEEAKRRRAENRKKEKKGQGSGAVELPPMTGALRSCLRKALEAARQEGTVSVRVRHVAHALVELPGTRAREAMAVEKLDVPAAATAIEALRGSDEAPEPTAVFILRTSGTFGKSGNPLARKFAAWVFGGGAGFGSAVVGAVRSEAPRVTVRCGEPHTRPVDTLLGILALDRSLHVAGRELPEKLWAANRGAELLRRHGARHDTLARVLLPTNGVEECAPAEVSGPADFERRLLHVAQFTASHHGSPTVGTTHLLAALIDGAGTDPESAAEIERVLTESGVDVDGLRVEPELQVPGGVARPA